MQYNTRNRGDGKAMFVLEWIYFNHNFLNLITASTLLSTRCSSIFFISEQDNMTFSLAID